MSCCETVVIVVMPALILVVLTVVVVVVVVLLVLVLVIVIIIGIRKGANVDPARVGLFRQGGRKTTQVRVMRQMVDGYHRQAAAVGAGEIEERPAQVRRAQGRG